MSESVSGGIEHRQLLVSKYAQEPLAMNQADRFAFLEKHFLEAFFQGLLEKGCSRVFYLLS